MKDAKLPESTDRESSSRGRLPFWLRDLLADIAGSPPEGFGARVLGGFVAPIVIALLSLHPFLTGTVCLYRKANPGVPAVTATGSGAVAFGLLILSVAAFLHFHFAWPYRNETVAGLGKLLSFLAGTIFAVVFFWKLIAM